MSVTTNDELYHHLRSLELNPKRCGNVWQCRCPAHDDNSPSLAARVTPEGKLLLHCHAGCSFMQVLMALGLRGGFSPTQSPSTKNIERPTDPNVLAEWQRMLASDARHEVERHEDSLGIPRGGLVRVGAVWAMAIGALAAPMYAMIGGTPIGVRLRADDGKKWCITGSKTGLFIPKTLTGEGPLYMPEGFTDTAALCGLGLDAVGRPSCNGGRDYARMAARMSARLVVVVSDRDGPGILGAEQLASEIVQDGVRVKIIKPPSGIKDVREWIAKGGTKEDIEYAVRHRGLCGEA